MKAVMQVLLVSGMILCIFPAIFFFILALLDLLGSFMRPK